MKNQKTILVTIVIGLAAWGIFHTVGAYRGAEPDDVDIRRSLVVAVSFALFMGFWGLMLWLRSVRLHQERQEREQEQEPRSDAPPRL